MSSGAKKHTRIDSLLSISHEKDVDGLGAAAIVWRYARAKGLKFDVILTDYGSFEKVFKKVSMRKNTLVIITDLGMDESLLDLITEALRRAISQGCKVVWLDHHQWSMKSIQSILSLPNKPILRVNHDYCAAEIAFKTLMPRDSVSEEIAKIAHDTDFNVREIESANAISDALTVTRFNAISSKQDMTEALMKILTDLADGGPANVWDEQTQQFKDNLLNMQVKNYRKERLRKMKKALDTYCDQMIHGCLVRVIQLPQGVTTTDFGNFMANLDNLNSDGRSMKIADLLITVSQGGLLGFRRGSDKVLCNKAAHLFNGGGHPYAAGGEYGSYSEFQDVCNDIFLRLSNSTEWLSSCNDAE